MKINDIDDIELFLNKIDKKESIITNKDKDKDINKNKNEQNSNLDFCCITTTPNETKSLGEMIASHLNVGTILVLNGELRNWQNSTYVRYCQTF